MHRKYRLISAIWSFRLRHPRIRGWEPCDSAIRTHATDTWMISRFFKRSPPEHLCPSSIPVPTNHGVSSDWTTWEVTTISLPPPCPMATCTYKARPVHHLVACIIFNYISRCWCFLLYACCLPFAVYTLAKPPGRVVTTNKWDYFSRVYTANGHAASLPFVTIFRGRHRWKSGNTKHCL